MTQTPPTDDFLLKWRGDTLTVTLTLDKPKRGRAAFRTNIGRARVRRREILAETERGELPLARAWTDIPLDEKAPGVFSAEIALEEVGIFSGKACFFPEGSSVPEWPGGANTHIKVESAETRAANSIYTVFPRQFGSFREVARRLDTIMDRMGFRIIQTLPPFPVPTSYAVMGEYGCPFAALDFLSVDPGMAEFDEFATPLDQFRELIEAVHARKGLFFVDLPANHTGWASTLQTHHPDWFHHEADGRFHSPGAWGVKWADLVELDYERPELRAYMADVFLFWCRNGVDGFRCDAGYMIPLKTWEYIVARVREEYPDTVFMLEGLGGKLETTDALLAEANLDWAYSEIFQTYDRQGFEWYLPSAIARSEKYGTLVHFAETHDNDRLAKGGETYARLRVQLAALLSWQGAWGIANGVEWFATEKIDVHGKNDLNWGAQRNMVDLIARLNEILRKFPAFQERSHLELVTEGGGNVLAVLRDGILVVANLDVSGPSSVRWLKGAGFDVNRAFDLITKRAFPTRENTVALGPGEVLCLFPSPDPNAPELDLTVRWAVKNATHVSDFAARPSLFHWQFPRDVKRDFCVAECQWVEVASAHHFRMSLIDPERGKTLRVYRSRTVPEKDGVPAHQAVRFDTPHYRGDGFFCRELDLVLTVYAPDGVKRTHSRFLITPCAERAKVCLRVPGHRIKEMPDGRTILSNGAGAASQMRVGWGRIASQYDAILAANPNPNVPSDRVNVWARTRCWLQREGYNRELDARCVEAFTADPSGRAARWSFRVPCGMGLETAFDFTVALAGGVNAARLTVTRRALGERDPAGSVHLVFRPDVEWRSFHATTKAYEGAEAIFPAAAEDVESGFSFHPYGGSFRLTCTNGAYHHEGLWTYNVPHPEEAARGQAGSGDLFSPGWFSTDLAAGESFTLTGSVDGAAAPFPEPKFVPVLPIGAAMRRAMDLFIVKRDDLKTVIAGYPWFLDWGRDTFIFMRGMIAAGMLEDSLRILQAFARFEENGTLPNIISGETAANRDTTDAPLWFVRCVQELEEKVKGVERVVGVERVEEVERVENVERVEKVEGVSQHLNISTSQHLNTSTSQHLNTSTSQHLNTSTSQHLNTSTSQHLNVSTSQHLNTSTSQHLNISTSQLLRRTCESIVANYIKGTPNGIRVDPASGLVWSPAHFTWMDTNYPACTPRVGYPVEIQALWISALRYVGKTDLAEKALASVKKYFKIANYGLQIADGQTRDASGQGERQETRDASGQGERQETRDASGQGERQETRDARGYCDCLAAPNGEPAALAVPEDTIRPNQLFLITLGILDDPSIVRATEELLVPGGIRSLNAGHRLYCGRYEGDEDTRRKPAYHNGTVWAWPFPLYAEALVKTGLATREAALDFLTSAVESLNAGCVGHLSEIADGDSPHAQKGCTAQAWSVSEMLRVWLALGGE